jgi:hypothetical protein
MRQGCDGEGLRASGGSWYLREILVPSTRLACFASAPVVLKLGFSMLAGAPPYFEGGWTESSRPRKETSCEGSGFFVRWCGEGERAPDCDRVCRRRLGAGDAEAERLRSLRERSGRGERERRLSFDLSLRRLSFERERWRRLCLSSERSRLLSLAESLSLDRSRRPSFERSRRRSLERLLLRSPTRSRLLSLDLSRLLSRERSRLRSGDLSRFLSVGDARGFLYGSGETSRARSIAVAAGGTARASRSVEVSPGRRSPDLLRGRRSGIAEGSLRAGSGSLFTGGP